MLHRVLCAHRHASAVRQLVALEPHRVWFLVSKALFRPFASQKPFWPQNVDVGILKDGASRMPGGADHSARVEVVTDAGTFSKIPRTQQKRWI